MSEYVLPTDNYTKIHVHSTMSNGTYFDSTASYEDLIKKAKKEGMSSIAITEHGNVLQWIDKKNKADSLSVKYIHGCEFYLTFNPDKQLRETYHILLYAKNFAGVKELNALSSKSFEGVGEKWYPNIHYYYRPRITFDELKNTSENIIISTSCMASPLNRLEDTNEDYVSYVNFLKENRNRVFLEVQPHIRSEHQKKYNKKILQLSKTLGIKVIAGTDTHVIDKEDNRLRSILQNGKHSSSEENGEELFDLHFRSYNELVDEFREQGILSDIEIYDAISNTNVLSEMCENWELDKTFKYPHISKNPEEELWGRVQNGIATKNINYYPTKKKEKYINRITEEFEVFKQIGMCEYILLLDDIVNFCNENKISISPRGSANGSQLLWTMGLTQIDAIRYNTLFFRFANPKRVSLGDVDIDMAGEKRPLVKDYLYNREDMQSCAIVTYKKLGLKGACRLVAKGLGIPLDIEDIVAKDIHEEKITNEDETETVITTFENESKWREAYPEWIEMSYKALGIVEYTSVHACGFVVYDKNINEDLGTFRTKKSKWIISQNDMKAIDSVNFVKMDFLAVDNVQIVSEVEDAIGEKSSNDDINLEDDNVWDEIQKSGIGIFQFEKSGFFSLRRALQNYETFKEYSPSVTRYDIMLTLNGVIRPSCDSFRDDYLNGIPFKTNVEPIDDFLINTGGRVIFQEQIMLFLEKFCGYDGAESDMVRRAIAKKKGTDSLVPEIRERFTTFFPQKYGVSKEQSEQIIEDFLKIIIDSSDYGFSINHSCPYTLLGYKNAKYRHYHPLEYFTVQLNVNDGKFEKTSDIINYITSKTDIKINPIKFGKSKSLYSFDKENNAIYKGLTSIKNIGGKVGDELYLIRDYKGSFAKLLGVITNETSVNQGVVKQLIQLGFFEEFGKMKKLMTVYNLFYDNKQYSKSVAKKDNLIFDESLLRKYCKKESEKQFSGVDYISLIEELEKDMAEDDFSMTQKIAWQLEYIGSINYIDTTQDVKMVVVTDLDTKYTPKFNAYCIKKGTFGQVKVRNKPRWKETNVDSFSAKPFKNGDVLYIDKFVKEYARKKVNDEWVTTDEIEWWALNYQIIERS